MQRTMKWINGNTKLTVVQARQINSNRASLAHHVPLEDMVHNLMPRQSGGIHQQLKGELEPWVHLTPAGLSLAFLPPALRVR